jgi:hypothetical protein
MEEKVFDVPPQGSLGLLALGHIGLLAWRNARKAYEAETGTPYRSFYILENKTSTAQSSDYLNSGNEAS